MLVANLVIVPLAMVVLTALNLGPTARDPAHHPRLFPPGVDQPHHLGASWAIPLIFALGSTCLAMVIGVFFAFMVERTDMPMKSFAYAVVPLTIAIPGLLYGIAWVLLLSPRIGLFNLALLSLFGKDTGLLTSWAGIGFSGRTHPGLQHGRHDLRRRHPWRRRRVPA